MLEGVLTKGTGGSAGFSVSKNGSLVHLPPGAFQGGSSRQLVWTDRQGQEEALDAELAAYRHVRVSPDGAHLALDVDGVVQTYDIARGTFNRVTTDPGLDWSPIWTPDGALLVFQSDREGTRELYWTPADGTGTPERIVTPEGNVMAVVPDTWVPDGTTLLFTQTRAGITADIWTLSMEGDLTADLLIEDEFITSSPAISTDGRWIAYDSDLSGQAEVYVQRFPDLGNRQLISTDGGRQPRWSPDGTELFYQSTDGRQLLVVPIASEPAFAAGIPEVLVEGPYLSSTGGRRTYDITPEGDRFVMIKVGAANDNDEPPQITLVQNWFQELNERVPVP